MVSPNEKANAKNQADATVIQLKQAGQQPLSKEQQAFNKLTHRIDFLQNAIAAETEKLDMLSAMHQQEVGTKVIDLANLRAKIACLLDQKRAGVKLSKAMNRKLDEVIFDLLDFAARQIALDEEATRLYESFQNAAEDDPQLNAEMMAEFFYQNFGVRVDPDHLAGEPDFDKINDDIRQQFNERAAQQKPRKKTKKQLEKEALEAQKESLKKKSLRSIYISLVKILHPDTEPDEALKAEKEETMKKVTTAYENSDMVQLLQIEMQWVKKHEDLLAKADKDTLAAYIGLLKDQVADLEVTRSNLRMNPRYLYVFQYQSVNLNSARKELRDQGKLFMHFCQVGQRSVQRLEKSANPGPIIKQFIDEFYDGAGALEFEF